MNTRINLSPEPSPLLGSAIHPPTSDVNFNRFFRTFPVAATLLARPRALVLLSGVAAGLAALVSVHLALSVATLGLAAVLVGVQRRFLSDLLLPPVLAGSLLSLSGICVGSTFLAAAGGWKWSEPLFMTQATLAFGFCCLGMAITVLMHKLPAIQVPRGSQVFLKKCLRPLGFVAWTLIAMQSIHLVSGLMTGRLDRGQFGEDAFLNPFVGITPIELVPRYIGAGLVLWPAAWLTSGGIGRMCLGACACAIVGIGAITGSRGLFAYPLIFVAVGGFLFLGLSASRLRFAAACLLALLAVVVPAMKAFRDSEEFFSTPAWDVGTRAVQLMDAMVTGGQDQSMDSVDRLWLMGVQLVGVSDELVYAAVPGERPFVGGEGLSGAVTAWVPQFIMRDRPVLMDGNEIVLGLIGESQTRTFATISFEADLYRRWGWSGILVGVPMMALVFAAFVRAVFSILLFKDAVLGFTLLPIVLSSYFIRPFSTVLWTFQIWMYDIPKHVAFAFVLVWIARSVTGASSRVGLSAWSPHR